MDLETVLARWALHAWRDATGQVGGKGLDCGLVDSSFVETPVADVRRALEQLGRR